MAHDAIAARETAASEHSRTVEALTGGAGREVFFRPQRYSAAELDSIKPTVELSYGDGASRECPLVDVSQNGVALLWPGDRAAPAAGEKLARLAVRFGSHVAYAGEGRIGSVRASERGLVVGASFADGLMNMDDVLQLREVFAWRGQARGLGLDAVPWRIAGRHEFKALVSELRLFLEDAERELGRLEQQLPWHVVQGDSDSPARQALVDRLAREFTPEFVRYTVDINAAAAGAGDTEWNAMRDFATRMLDSLLLRAPFLQRARAKPRGYPGDFLVMSYLYEPRLEGRQLFDKALHYSCVFMPATQSVLGRRDFVVDRLLRLARGAGRGRPLRIASVACGPAQDTVDFLRELGENAPPMHLVLFDQDEEALAYAQRRIAPLAERAEGRVQVTYLHDSIKRLVSDPLLFEGFGPFDHVSCTGLFDYLRDKTAVSLIRTFYDNAAPGGTVLVANVVPENPTRWLAEFHCEWFLIHRTRDQLHDLARQAAPDARISIEDERSHVTPFAVIQKP